MQKKLIFFIVFIAFQYLLPAAENTVPVTYSEQLGSGISVVLSAGMIREDADFCRIKSAEADKLLLNTFRFPRGTVKNRLQIVFSSPEDGTEFYFSIDNGIRTLHCPGSKDMWLNDTEYCRKILNAMLLAALGKIPSFEVNGWDWLLTGLADELMLPGNEDEIWRVGYYYGLQNAFAEKHYPVWETVMLLNGKAATRLEAEICRLLLDISEKLDNGSQRLLQDYVLLLWEKKTDSVTAYWSTVGYRISDGGTRREKGSAELDSRAVSEVFSTLSPWPAQKIQDEFEKLGKLSHTAYDLKDDKKSEKISGTWEDWPSWCGRYDMTMAAENTVILLKDLSGVSGVLVAPEIRKLQNLLGGAAPGIPLDSAQWNTALRQLRTEIERQKELEKMLFRLEERNPRLNERIKSRVDAVEGYEYFPLPENFEEFITKTEDAVTGSRR